MGRKKRKSLVEQFLTVFLQVILFGTIAGGLLLTVCLALKILPVEQKKNSNNEEEIWPEEERNGIDDTENQIVHKEAEHPGGVTLAFAGDILLDDYYSMMATMRSRNLTIGECFSQELLEEMKSADIFMLNNEFTYTDRGEPIKGKQFTFRANPENAKLLHELGVDIVSLANNHAYDYGEISLLDTMDALQSVDIPYVGGGHNLEEASAAVYFEVNDIKIGYLSATQIEKLYEPDTKGATEKTPGVFRCLNPDKLYEMIAETKENCDFVVVYVHWGSENVTELDREQKEQARGMVSAGADLIIGAHPHCLQGIEYIEGVPIIYSLGNFWFNSKTVDTGMVKVTIDATGIRTFQFVPAKQEDCMTFMLHGGEKERVINDMRALSPTVSIDGEGYVTDSVKDTLENP